jgi:DNA polymerase-3 subunit alpha
VSFDLMEVEKILIEKTNEKIEIEKPIAVPAPVLFDQIIESDDTEVEYMEAIVEEDDDTDIAPRFLPEKTTEENKIITHLPMGSRTMKVKISGELLAQLEALQVHFKLN